MGPTGNSESCCGRALEKPGAIHMSVDQSEKNDFQSGNAFIQNYFQGKGHETPVFTPTKEATLQELFENINTHDRFHGLKINCVDFCNELCEFLDLPRISKYTRCHAIM